MKHVKSVEVVRDPSTGRPVNRITTRRGIVIELEGYRYPEIEDQVELVEMVAQAVEQVVKNLLQNATITVDPTTNKITITFK
jgi:hypothetical protein